MSGENLHKGDASDHMLDAASEERQAQNSRMQQATQTHQYSCRCESGAMMMNLHSGRTHQIVSDGKDLTLQVGSEAMQQRQHERLRLRGDSLVLVGQRPVVANNVCATNAGAV